MQTHAGKHANCNANSAFTLKHVAPHVERHSSACSNLDQVFDKKLTFIISTILSLIL